MLLQVTLKSPDTLATAVNEAVEQAMRDDPMPAWMSDDQRRFLAENRADAALKLLMAKWVEDGAYYVIAFDTDAGTATVVGRE